MCEAMSRRQEGLVLGMYHIIEIETLHLPGCKPFWQLSLGLIDGGKRTAFLTERNGRRELPRAGQWMMAMVLLTQTSSDEESLAEIGDYICL